jgi:hypothetical protein
MTDESNDLARQAIARQRAVRESMSRKAAQLTSGRVTDEMDRKLAERYGVATPTAAEQIAMRVIDLADEKGNLPPLREVVESITGNPLTPPEVSGVPAGNGGAREPDRPPAGIDEQIAEAEAAGNFREAMSLKSRKLASLPKP